MLLISLHTTFGIFILNIPLLFPIGQLVVLILFTNLLFVFLGKNTHLFLNEVVSRHHSSRRLELISFWHCPHHMSILWWDSVLNHLISYRMVMLRHPRHVERRMKLRRIMNERRKVILVWKRIVRKERMRGLRVNHGRKIMRLQMRIECGWMRIWLMGKSWKHVGSWDSFFFRKNSVILAWFIYFLLSVSSSFFLLLNCWRFLLLLLFVNFFLLFIELNVGVSLYSQRVTTV